MGMCCSLFKAGTAEMFLIPGGISRRGSAAWRMSYRVNDAKEVVLYDCSR